MLGPGTGPVSTGSTLVLAVYLSWLRVVPGLLYVGNFRTSHSNASYCNGNPSKRGHERRENSTTEVRARLYRHTFVRIFDLFLSLFTTPHPNIAQNQRISQNQRNFKL